MADQTRAQQRRAVAVQIGVVFLASPSHSVRGELTDAIESALLAAEAEQRRRDAAMARGMANDTRVLHAMSDEAAIMVAEAIEADTEEG